MNKRNMIPFLVMVALCFSVSMALADTDVSVTGNGAMDATTIIAYDDDAITRFDFHGYGSFDLTGVGRDNTGYPYMGVDKTTTSVKSDITVGGGWLEFETIRLDSYGSYGAPGQRSYSYVGSSDAASLDFRTTTNYASLVSSNYNFQSSQQFTASGSFNIIHELDANPTEFAFLNLVGSGSASVDYMADGYTSANGYYFGTGDGCCENADLTATGSGFLRIEAYADNNLWAHDGSWAQGGGSFTGTWSYTGSLLVDDYAIGGN